MLLIWVNSRPALYFKVLYFGVLFLIISSLIVDLFVCVYRISFHWSWYFSWGLIENCLWDVVYKLDMHIPPHADLWKVMVMVLVVCNFWNPTNEYFTIREYSEILPFMSLNFLKFEQIRHKYLQRPCKCVNWHQNIYVRNMRVGHRILFLERAFLYELSVHC